MNGPSSELMHSPQLTVVFGPISERVTLPWLSTPLYSHSAECCTIACVSIIEPHCTIESRTHAPDAMRAASATLLKTVVFSIEIAESITAPEPMYVLKIFGVFLTTARASITPMRDVAARAYCSTAAS